LNLPTDVTVLGDDHFVYLWHENRLLERLSAIDGQKIDEQELDVSPAMMVHQIDALVWTASRDEQLELNSLDLLSGRTVWTRREARDAQIVVLDEETLAVATPEGKLNLLAARTGAAVCEPLEIDTRSLIGLLPWRDNERWYLALMRPPENGNAW